MHGPRFPDSRPLYYYKENHGFFACESDPIELLKSDSGSGQCGSFAQLLMWSLGMNGIASNFVSISPVDADTRMIVKEWAFGTPTYPSEPIYKWQMFLNIGDLMVPARHTFPYYGDLANQADLPGQNTRPPSEKVFDRHFIVKVNPSLPVPGQGPYFDPSYGVWYAGPADFEAKAIAGYTKRLGTDTGESYHVRKPGGVVNVSLVP